MSIPSDPHAEETSGMKKGQESPEPEEQDAGSHELTAQEPESHDSEQQRAQEEPEQQDAKTQQDEESQPFAEESATAEKSEAVPDEAVEPRMGLLDHLNELRIRLVRCLIAAAVGFMLCYGFSEKLFNLLVQPLIKVMPGDGKLIYTSLPEPFFVYLQVGLVAGVLLATPYIFYQIWAFISPGLYDEEKKYLVPLAACSAFFFLSGTAFCFFLVFPIAFNFFMSFTTDMIIPMPTLDLYLSFVLKMLFAFGIIFEMPLFIFFLARLGLVTPESLRKTRKYAILGIFIVAAILTPPDVFSQVLMAMPMLVLYEIGIWVAVFFGKKKKTPDDKVPEDLPAKAA